jgi:predicted DNA-binding protein
MTALSKRSTIYLDPALHQALRLKALETSRSMSEIINEAVKEALAEDAEDLAAFDERADEPLISYEQMVLSLPSLFPEFPPGQVSERLP